MGALRSRITARAGRESPRSSPLWTKAVLDSAAPGPGSERNAPVRTTLSTGHGEVWRLSPLEPGARRRSPRDARR